MANKDMQQVWQQQQQQQQQTQYALPNQFWQPSQVELPRQYRNDVDSLFAQTLLGGGNADFSNLDSLFPNGISMNQNLFPQNGTASFGGMGASGPTSNAAASVPFQAFGPANSDISAMGLAASAAAPPGSTLAMPSRANGGVGALLLPSSNRGPPEHWRMLRRRSARALAQVNRLWAKRGATYFVNLPNDYQLDEDDVRYIEQEEATSPHIKLACIRLPNGWDEGDLSENHSSNNNGASPTRAAYDTDNKANSFLQLSYHIYNYRHNPNYSLPPFLKPTPLQMSTPHDQMIDALAWPAIRDKLVQMPEIELHSFLIDLIRFLSPGDGDVNSERNWVLTLPFFIRYPQLADASLLAMTNAQRKERGQSEVSMDDVWKEHRQFQQYAEAKLKEVA